MSRLLLGIAGLVVLLAATVAARSQEPAAERKLMSEETYEILRNAVIEATEVKEYDPAGASDTMEMIRKEQPERFKRILKRHREEYAKLRKENLETLDVLAKQPWPKVSELEWVHIFPRGKAEEYRFPGWLVSEDQHKAVLIGEYLQDLAVDKNKMEIDRIEPADFAADLQDLTDLLEKGETPWMAFTRIRGWRYAFHEGAYLFGYAYAAASAGLRKETNTIVAFILYPNSPYPQRLRGPYNELVWEVLRPAMLEFSEGGSRQKFLGTCKELLANYPGSDFDEQLRSWIEPMEREAEAPPPGFLHKKPEQLTEEEQAQRAVYRLRDTAGQMLAQPGRPYVFALGSPTEADEVVKLGSAAVPYLIEVLEDGTPTRTLGWWRDFSPGWYLFRQRDVALLCLEKIAGRRFYDSEFVSGRFSTADLERRAEVIAEIRKWWSKREVSGVRRRRGPWIPVVIGSLLMAVALSWLAVQRRRRKGTP